MSDAVEMLRLHLAEFRSEVMAKLCDLAAMQAEHGNSLRKLTESQDHCSGWQIQHEEHHGLHRERKPWIWVANSTSWAWHHPGRTILASLAVVALVLPAVRDWLVANIPVALRLAIGGSP